MAHITLIVIAVFLTPVVYRWVGRIPAAVRDWCSLCGALCLLFGCMFMFVLVTEPHSGSDTPTGLAVVGSVFLLSAAYMALKAARRMIAINDRWMREMQQTVPLRSPSVFQAQVAQEIEPEDPAQQAAVLDNQARRSWGWGYVGTGHSRKSLYP
jgi:hypothetical protein